MHTEIAASHLVDTHPSSALDSSLEVGTSSHLAGSSSCAMACAVD
jgi:hypothetical protein